MTTCRELIEFLMGYLDNELPQEQRRAFDAHLNACPPCRAYVESYAQTVRLGRAAGADHPPTTPPPEALVRAILEARRADRGDTPPAR